MGNFIMTLLTSLVFTFLEHNAGIFILLHNDVMYQNARHCKVCWSPQHPLTTAALTLAVVKPNMLRPLQVMAMLGWVQLCPVHAS